jgi:hypothetical protein
MNSFPNPMNTSYHFRFRVEDKVHGYCWLDVQDFETLIPIYDGKIIAKILKLDDTTTSQRKLRLKLKKRMEKHIEQNTRLNAEFVSSMMEDDHNQPATSPIAPQRVMSQPLPQSQQPFAPATATVETNEYKAPSSGKINKIAPPPSSSSNPSPQPTSGKSVKQTDDLLFGYDDPAQSPQTNTATAPSNSSAATAQAEDILFDFTDAPPAAAVSTKNVSPPKSMMDSAAAQAPPIVKTTVTMDIDDDRAATSTSWTDGLKAPAVNKGKLCQSQSSYLSLKVDHHYFRGLRT